MFVCLTVVGSTLPAVVVGSPASPDRPGATTGGLAAQSGHVSFVQRSTGNVFLANETPTVGVRTSADRLVWTVERYGGQRVANGTVPIDYEQVLELPIEEVGHYELHVWPVGSTGRTATTTLSVLPADGFRNEDPFYGMSTPSGRGGTTR